MVHETALKSCLELCLVLQIKCGTYCKELGLFLFHFIVRQRGLFALDALLANCFHLT